MENFKAYWQFVKPYRALILLTIAVGIVKFGIPLTLPLIMKYVVDDLLLGDLTVAEKTEKLAYTLAGALVLFVIVRWPVEYYRQYFAQLTTSKILFDMRKKLYDHIQKLSIRYYQNRKAGEIISRFINDVESTSSLVETGLMNIWLDLFTLSLAIGVMFYLNPVLTLISLCVFPFYGIASKILYKRLRELSRSRSQALAEIQGYLHERIQGIPVIRSFTLERYEREQFGGKNQKYLQRALALTRWNALTFAIINTLTDIAPLLVIGYGGYEVIRGELSPGSFVAFFGYLDRIYNPLRRLVTSSTTLVQAVASLDRVLEFMREPYEIVDAPHAVELKSSSGRIDFENVWFRYNDQGDWVLKNINLTIHPGQTVALVGMSGGGKSSLISLIPRFYDIQRGAIRIDGQNIRDVTQNSLRSRIGMVLQDSFLFSGTVRENIMLGRPGASEEEMIRAAIAANAHEFILGLPKGYDTEIGERDVKLSGGQKQRIAIARVFLKNPDILILDEATSALDLESEQLIQKSLDLLVRNRTTLIVAHRLSTITHADQIVVIEEGEVKEKGTHQELMMKDGIYAKLFNVQHLQEKSTV